MPRCPAEPRTNELYRFRMAKGWTQADMAKAMGISRRNYQRLEAERRLTMIHSLALETLKIRHSE